MAPLASMTGYARAAGALPGVGFTVEIKSVNGRGLDLRLRLAAGFDVLEAEIRRVIGKSITRGSLTVSLTVDREGEGGRVVVNHQALEAVLEGFRWLESRLDADKPRLDGILALRGVLEQHETALSADDEEALSAAILTAVAEAVAGLAAARREEGARIAAILSERIDEIAALTKAAEIHPGRSRDAILARLRQQVADLSEASPTLSDERLAQEAVLLATKADIREELDRLGAHIAAARQLLASGGPVGRKLDFLSQEFNREANTLCSKSNDVALTAIGLDLKAVIDQLREQVQNIE
ncbi:MULTISPECIES: YicC/YloC family endoribonuclease [unclassified Devosia]|uniref:YicC/YloC family endoribonuclease n=1 Tax=unclassified Devosia TaxID=196773 RepID=UPI000B1D8A6C|nr:MULTISPECIES: YicC/YloC family endoribonuclease [unclassified Devosia]